MFNSIKLKYVWLQRYELLHPGLTLPLRGRSSLAGLSHKLLNFVGLGLLDEGLEGERDEEVAVALVELGLELDPVQAERVQEGGQAFHQAQDADRQRGPEGKDGPKDDASVPEMINKSLA